MNHTAAMVPEDSYHAWLGELSRLRQVRRSEEGMYAGKPLNGYLRNPAGGPHLVDETKRHAIRRLFLEARRKSFRKLIDIAREEGLRNASGTEMGLSSLHNMLSNPFYAGMVRIADIVVQGRHEGIVILKEFDGARQASQKIV